MTVTEIWIDRNFEWESFADMVQPAERPQGYKPGPESEVNTFNMLHRVATVCNNANFTRLDSDGTISPQSTIGSFAAPGGRVGRPRDIVSRDNSVASPSLPIERLDSMSPRRTSSSRRRNMSERSMAAGQIEYFGNPSEIALLRYFNQLRNVETVRSAFPVVFEIPFNSANKWHLVITRSGMSGGAFTLMMKGAPEIILARCSHYLLKVRALRARLLLN